MNRKSIFVFLILFVFSSNGCATKLVDQLQLETILDIKAERELRAKTKAAQSVQTEVEEAKPKIEEKTPEEFIPASQEDPSELALLQLPEIFIRLSHSEQQSQKMRQTMERTFPKETAIWRAQNLDLIVMAWKNLTNTEKINTMSKDELIAELNHVGKQFDAFFEQTRKSRATFKVTEDHGNFVLKIKSNYLDFQDWYTQIRYVFFYRPDYRLNLIVIGKDEDLVKVSAELEQAVESFRVRLNKQFQNGFKIQ